MVILCLTKTIYEVTLFVLVFITIRKQVVWTLANFKSKNDWNVTDHLVANWKECREFRGDYFVSSAKNIFVNWSKYLWHVLFSCLYDDKLYPMKDLYVDLKYQFVDIKFFFLIYFFIFNVCFLFFSKPWCRIMSLMKAFGWFDNVHCPY